MADREVCIVPATSAAPRSIRRHFRECKADSVSLIQPCAAKYVKGRRQLRLRQEGSLLHLLIAMALVLWELLQQKVAGGEMAHPARAFDFRDVLSLTIAVASAIAFACFWQYRDAYATLPYALFCCLVRPAAAISITFFISSHFRIIHLPAAAALSVLKAICSVLGIVYIFLVTVLLKAGGDIFHALIMGAYIYIPAYVPYLAMASGLILGTRSKDWTGSPRYECRRAKRHHERQLLQQIQAMRSAKGCRLLSSLSMRLNTRYHLHAIAFLHLL